MNKLATEVCIVGGGPVGAALKIMLRNFGISAECFDMRNSISPHPKAHFLSPRTLEILELIGIKNL